MIGYVALGSNVGDPYANLVKARNYLNEDPRFRSCCFKTLKRILTAIQTKMIFERRIED